MKNKIKKMSPIKVEKCYRTSRLVFVIMSLSLLIATVYFGVQKLDFIMYISFFLACVLVILYPLYLWQFLQGLLCMATEELDPLRAIQSMSNIKADKGDWAFINYSYLYLILGEFGRSHDYLARIKVKKLQGKYLVSFWFISNFLSILQGQELDSDVFRQKMESGKFRTTREKSLAHEKFQVLQAISDIESGQVNSYFETAEAKNNLDKLIYQFYQAKNQVLLGNADKAKELFATVAHSNNDIYFVQKAREYLKEK